MVLFLQLPALQGLKISKYGGGSVVNINMYQYVSYTCTVHTNPSNMIISLPEHTGRNGSNIDPVHPSATATWKLDSQWEDLEVVNSVNSAWKHPGLLLICFLVFYGFMKPMLLVQPYNQG